MDPRQTVGFADHRDWIQRLPIDGHGIARFKMNVNLLRLIRCLINGGGHGKHLFRRSHHGIFQRTGLNTASEQIEIDGIRRFLAHGSRNPTALAIGNRLLPTHAPLAGGS